MKGGADVVTASDHAAFQGLPPAHLSPAHLLAAVERLDGVTPARWHMTWHKARYNPVNVA